MGHGEAKRYRALSQDVRRIYREAAAGFKSAGIPAIDTGNDLWLIKKNLVTA
jgi:hypothetical protein